MNCVKWQEMVAIEKRKDLPAGVSPPDECDSCGRDITDPEELLLQLGIKMQDGSFPDSSYFFCSRCAELQLIQRKENIDEVISRLKKRLAKEKWS